MRRPSLLTSLRSCFTSLTILVAGCGGGGAMTMTGGSDLAGPPADGGTSSDSGAVVSNQPGKYVRHLTVEGMDREVIVYVPAKAAGATPVPAVFMLHGTSGDGEKFYNISGWKEKADAEGLIAVFPSALTYCLYEDENSDGDFDDAGERKVTTKWAAGKLGDPTAMPLCTSDVLATLSPQQRALADHPLRDDVAYFQAILDLLGSEYAVDAKRIYASGFSSGGQMTALLTMKKSDKFAATACAAGFLFADPEAAARPLSVVLTMGDSDEHLPVTPVQLREVAINGFRGTAVDPMLAVLQLEDPYQYSEQVLNGKKTSRWTWTTSKVNAGNSLSFVLIEGLNHQYPNGSNHPIVAADTLWTFFKTQHLP